MPFFPRLLPLAAIVLVPLSIPAASQPPAVATAPASGYADLVDLTLAADKAAVATITRAVRLKPAEAPGLLPGYARFYVTGTVDALLAGRGGLPAEINWLADVSLDARGRPPKLKKRRVVVLARGVPGRPAMLQLVARSGQIDWSPAVEQRVRAILTQSLAADAPPAITGVGHAFHVPGSIPGESETQIFLKTADARPVSLSILRRPGEAPRWSVSLGEIVSDSAAPPAPETLLWYRLACGLPATLPDEAVADQSPDDAAAARADYQVVIAGLGPCGRTDQPR